MSSEIDPRPMEVHLLKICEEVIKLNYDEDSTNTKHFRNICTLLFKKMSENDEIFEELFQSWQLAGSYPDDLKISEPNEYDLLIVLKFPSPRVVASRSGYVTINISDAPRRNGWEIDEIDYSRFVDEEGYLIQNNVLTWIRDVVRSTLQELNYSLTYDDHNYDVVQTSNGPAVTLDVSVVWGQIQFSIDFVGCLAFQSDEWWMSDMAAQSGVWNAIPKPLKMDDEKILQYVSAQLEALRKAKRNAERKAKREAKRQAQLEAQRQAQLEAQRQAQLEEQRKAQLEAQRQAQLEAQRQLEVQRREMSQKKEIKTLEADGKWEKKVIASKKVNEKSGKVKRPPSFFRYRNRKPKVNENAETPTAASTNRNTQLGTRYRRPRGVKTDADVKCKKPIAGEIVDYSVPNTQTSKWEKATVHVKENTSGVAGHRSGKSFPWYRRMKKTKVQETVEETLKNRNGQCEKQAAEVEEKIKGGKSTGTVNNTKAVRKRKTPSAAQREEPVSIIIPNPKKNREWICSYAELERQCLRGTNTMKPLIRIFKKIRDNKQLTNLKSYFIKTIFLHQNLKNGNEYWQQSLAVLFMEMVDVVLKHLDEYQLDNFWHRDFNLLDDFSSEQVDAIYYNWLKMKNDLLSNLKNDNPEFIYEVVCTEDERNRLGQFV